MFNLFSDHTSVQHSEPEFRNEKELLLYVIEHATYISSIYSKNAQDHWKAQYPVEEGYYVPYCNWEVDSRLICHLAITSDDEEILRAIHDNHQDGFNGRRYTEIYLNPNLPCDLLDYYLDSDNFFAESLSDEDYRMSRMSRVGFNDRVCQMIRNRRDEIATLQRKIKEDKAKDKLKAYLIAASATKSVWSGNSIDDAVESSIDDSVDDEALNQLINLLGKTN